MRAPHFFLKHTHPHDQLCAVSDDVYAFALRLLVLDLKVPEVAGIANPQLTTDLLQQIPNFFAYIIGFSVVAFFWMSHHRIFQSVASCDGRALILSLIHLLFISLAPYVASLIGHYEGDRIATIVFSANLGLASLSLIVLGQYVLMRKERRTNKTGGTWVKIPLWTVYTGPGLALVSILVSFRERRYRAVPLALSAAERLAHNAPGIFRLIAHQQPVIAAQIRSVILCPTGGLEGSLPKEASYINVNGLRHRKATHAHK